MAARGMMIFQIDGATSAAPALDLSYVHFRRKQILDADALEHFRAKRSATGFHAETDLAQGALVQVLSENPPSSVPVSLLYRRNRQLSPRVRVFIGWLMRAFGRA